MTRHCYQCGEESALAAGFCYKCGAPLALDEFVSRKVQEQISTSMRDRNLLETESAIKVFERAWGWVKIVGTITGAVLFVAGIFLTWRVHDLNTVVSTAQSSVEGAGNDARRQITQKSSETLSSIKDVSAKTELASHNATQEADRQSAIIRTLGTSASKQFASQVRTVKSEVSYARSQIRAASELQPQMKTMQDQLTAARDQLQAQQKVLSSSENFVKHVFSTHSLAVFDLKTLPSDQFVIVPPPSPQIKDTVLYVLLPTAPIQGTVQLQYRIFLQPPTSYLLLHNLLIFFWGDPAESLKQSEFTASYFPDTSDKDLIHKLAFHDDRVFADGEPLIKFGQPDTDFKGSKWIKVVDPSTGQPKP